MMLGHARGLFFPVSVYEYEPLSAELEGGTFGQTRLRRGSSFMVRRYSPPPHQSTDVGGVFSTSLRQLLALAAWRKYALKRR